MGQPVIEHPVLECPARLLRFVLFKEVSGLFEVVDATVDGDFVFASVFWDRDDAVDVVAALSDRFDEKVDVYHG